MYKSLRAFFLLMILFVFLSETIAQQTYWKRLSWNSSSAYINPQDSIMDLLQFSQSADGNSFIEIRTNRYGTKIMKLDLAGNILWESPGSYRGNHSNSWLSGLRATADSGLVYIFNYEYYDFPAYSEAHIKKLNSSGALEWSHAIPPIMHTYGTEQIGYDLAVVPNGYACLAIDSLFLFDLNGGLTGRLNFSGDGQILGLANGDMLVESPGFRGRIDSQGATIFSIPYNITLYETGIYSLTNDSIRFIDPTTGSISNSVYWTNPGASRIQILSNLGWLAYNQNDIWCYDNAGVLKWARNYSPTLYGLNLVAEQKDGSFISGGTFPSIREYPNAIDYSSFIFTIDSSGQSIIDGVSQITLGDANNDNVIDFGDALYVALAQGSIGPQRYDSILDNIRYPYAISSDLAEDFPGVFGIGENHKACDYSSDGIIDSIDLNWLSFFSASFGRGRITPYRINSTIQSNNLLPSFSWIPDKDSVFAGDTIRYHFIVGDNGIAVDSIFGLAFTLGSDTLQNWGVAFADSAMATNSSLGNLSDLWQINPRIFSVRHSLLIARRDLQNAYFVQDTIGYADFIILDSISANIDLTLSLLIFKAITAGGFPIDFQYNTKPVHIRSLINNIQESPVTKFTLYPVPVREQLILSQLPPGELLIQIFNDQGKECYSSYSHGESRWTINTGTISQGLYVVVIRDDKGGLHTSKFIKD
jgi:hypothetical protein